MATKQPKAQLVDLEVEEVSVVDHPANRRKFLIVKREDNMRRTALPAIEAREAIQKQEAQVESDDGFADLLGLPSQPEEASPAEPPPAEAAPEIPPVESPSGETPVAETPPAEAAPEASSAEPPPAEVAPAEPAPATTEPVEKAAGDTLKATAGVLQKLMALVNSVKAITGDKPISDPLLGQLRAVVGQLNLLGGRVGAQKGDDIEKVMAENLKALTGGMERLMGVVNKLKDMDASADVPPAVGTEIKAIASALSAVLGKYPTPKAKSDTGLIEAVLENPEIELEVFKSATGTDDADPELVIKVGAKMSKMRLGEYRKAVEKLMSILKDLEGEAVGKGHDPAVLDAIGKLASSFEIFKKDLEARVEKMETIRPAGNDGDPEPVEKDEGKNFWAGII